MHKARGDPQPDGDAPAPAFTLPARTNLPHHSPHKSGMGGKAWGTSRVQRTFCSLAAPPASPPKVLSYLVSGEQTSSCLATSFTAFLRYLILMIGKLHVSYQPLLGHHHKAVPKMKDDFVFVPRVQKCSHSWGALSSPCVEQRRSMRLVPQHEGSASLY